MSYRDHNQTATCPNRTRSENDSRPPLAGRTARISWLVGRCKGLYPVKYALISALEDASAIAFPEKIQSSGGYLLIVWSDDDPRPRSRDIQTAEAVAYRLGYGNGTHVFDSAGAAFGAIA